MLFHHSRIGWTDRLKHRVDIFFEKINKYMFATALRTLNSQMKLRENMVITSAWSHKKDKAGPSLKIFLTYVMSTSV